MEAMTEERAREIVGAICAFAFYTQGLLNDSEFRKQVGNKLHKVTLGEMLFAKTIVEKADRQAEQGPAPEGGRRLAVIPDDRLIAAVYVATAYEPQQAEGESMLDPIISVPPVGMHGKSHLLLASIAECN